MPLYEDDSSATQGGKRYRFNGIPKALWTSAGLRIGDDEEPAAILDLATPDSATAIRISAGAAPATAWKLEANDTDGAFEIGDITAGTTPAKIFNGAPDNSIYVDSSGRLGVGIAPSFLGHFYVATGSPDVMVETGSAAGQAGVRFKNSTQQWRLHVFGDGNCHLRDVTGSTNPVQIEPAAPSASLYVDSSGGIGLGLSSPSTNLHVQENNADTVPAQEIEQLGSGDAAVQVTIPSRSYAHGIDATDSKWKLCTSATAGAAVLGTNTLFAINSSGVIDSLKSDTLTTSSGTPYDAFASGTKMVFYQAAAPTGWTKDTTNNDAALRAVSGSGGGTGGTAPLSSANTGATALSVAQLPVHSHASPGGIGFLERGGINYIQTTGTPGPNQQTTANTATTGSGFAHDHSLGLKYIDVIVAAKN